MTFSGEPFSSRAWTVVRPHLRFAMLFSALVNLLYLAPTFYMIQVYDRVVPTRGLLTLLFITLVILFALGTLAILDQMRASILLHASVALDEELGPQLVRMTLTSRASGNSPQQVMREFDTLKKILSSPALGALFDLPWTPIYIIVATIIHPWLGLATIVGAIALLFLAIANDRATRAASKAAAERSSSTYFAQEALSGAIDTIRALGMREALVHLFVASRDASFAPGRAAARTSSRYAGTIKFARLALQSIALGIGALLAVNDMISAGAIISASVLMSRALGPIDQMVGSWRTLGDGRNALAALNEFWRGQKESGVRTALPRPRALLQAEGLNVLSPGRDRFLLKEISFSVDRPAIVALIGPSGAGKTTLLQMLANAREPDRGAVRLDHASHADWDPEELATHIGYLPQESILLSGTVKDNISRFRARLGEEVDGETVAAATKAGCHDMILRLPNGYDTLLGPGGKGLSAGEQQRVALARALYRDPMLILLDEPYSALDNEAETRLAATLVAMRENGAIVVVAAHKNTIIRMSDFVILLRDGAMHAFGPTGAVMNALQKAAGQPRPDVVPAP